MEWWQAVVLGLVEGISEFLPISSTGHLILASHLIGLGNHGGRAEEAVKAFEVVVQAGAILAVVGLYWPRFVQMLRGLLGRDPAGLRLLLNLVIAFFPAALVGLALSKKIEKHLFYPGPVIAALIVGGIYMIALELWRAGRFSIPRPAAAERGIDDLTPRDALLIGLMQCFALWPGTSRSMMTMTGGYVAGLRPAAAAEFSFLLGVPTLLAAAGYKLFKDLRHAAKTGQDNLFQVLGPGVTVLGILVAAFSAAIAIKWLVHYLGRHGLIGFGWYRIALGIVMIGLVLAGVVHFGPPAQTSTPTANAPSAARQAEGLIESSRGLPREVRDERHPRKSGRTEVVVHSACSLKDCSRDIRACTLATALQAETIARNNSDARTTIEQPLRLLLNTRAMRLSRCSPGEASRSLRQPPPPDPAIFDQAFGLPNWRLLPDRCVATNLA